MLEYTVISNTWRPSREGTLQDLIKDVNAKMLDGWTPLGGISVAADAQSLYRYQAMIRDTTAPKKRSINTDGLHTDKEENEG